jgi:hypothetical protein
MRCIPTSSQDPSRCTSLDEAVVLMQLNTVMKSAISLMKGLEIEMDDVRIKIIATSAVSWFKVGHQQCLVYGQIRPNIPILPPNRPMYSYVYTVLAL